MAAARAKVGWRSAAGARPRTWATAQEQGGGGREEPAWAGPPTSIRPKRERGRGGFPFYFQTELNYVSKLFSNHISK